MHTRLQKSIDDMTFDELDALREELNLPQVVVCQRGDLNTATYSRWRRWARGEPKGSAPTRRSINVIRDVLKIEASRRLSFSDGSASLG